jgi:hypothetical protein
MALPSLLELDHLILSLTTVFSCGSRGIRGAAHTRISALLEGYSVDPDPHRNLCSQPLTVHSTIPVIPSSSYSACYET